MGMRDGISPEILHALRRREIEARVTDGGVDGLFVNNLAPSDRDLFYALMQRYSFRLVLRDVIRLGRGRFSPGELTRHSSLDAVRGYLDQMKRLAIVGAVDDEFTLVHDLRSLGPLMEWFVAEVLKRELGFDVAIGIPMRGGRTGGDLDVVAMAEGTLMYVEVKSGPPRHQQLSHVAAFLERVDALSPHGAIFYEDTELRMADKIVVLFEEALSRQGIDIQPRRLQRGLFTVGDRIFVANACPDAVSSLTRCVSRLFRQQGIKLVMDRGACEG